MPVTLSALNSMDQAAFTAALGHLFEHSAWVAEQTWPSRPFATPQALHAALCSTLSAAPLERKLALIRAHPDLDRAREEIEAAIGSQSKVIALLRDDLGYLVENIDFSEMRFLHILEVRVLPGHEGDFAASGPFVKQMRLNTSGPIQDL